MPPERPFTARDALLLVASLVAGITWAATAWPTLFHIFAHLFRWGGYSAAWGGYSASRMRHVDLAEAAEVIRVGSRLLAASLGPPTLMVVALASLGPRSARLAAWRRPGVMACAAAASVLLLEVAAYFLWPGVALGELTRAQGDARNNIVQLPRLSVGANLLGTIACGVGEHPGLAVAGVFFACWAAGLRPSGTSWLDRLGRLLGAAWIVAALGFLAVPILAR